MPNQNLGQFAALSASKHKDKVAFQIKRGLRTEKFTYHQVYSLSLKTATFLAKKGLKKGDKVAIWASNMPQYPIFYFGCWLLGVVAVPIDVRTTQETLRVFLEKARPKIGFRGHFVPGEFPASIHESFYLEELVDLVQKLPEANHLPKVDPDELAEIAFTSGTTGTPKGVMLTHKNFLSDVESLTEVFPFKANWRALSLLPLSHAFEQVVDFLALYQEGIPVTYLERTNSLTILKALRKEKITSVALVPQVLRLLLSGIEREIEKQGKAKQFKRASRVASRLPLFARRLIFSKIHQKLGGKLKFFGSGSAPLDLKLARTWETLGIEIFEGYGATETTAALTINTPSSKRLGSVGKVMPEMELKIDPKTHEITAHGPNISPGYFEDKERTAKAFSKGWYRTGDVGEIDKDGFLFITGREAFRIVLPNGQKVYPEDLEKKLNAHPLVKEASVVGIKREEGEVVHAAIITKHPGKLDEIIKEVNARLASHEQILESSVWKGEDFPRTPILKVDRRRVLDTVVGAKFKAPATTFKPEDKLIKLITQVTKTPQAKIKNTSALTTDLKLDSLGRVELLSLIEQEFAVAIPESKVTPQTTVSTLRKLIGESPPATEEIPINEFHYSRVAMKIRPFLQNFLAFPLHALFAPMEIHGKENLQNLKLPAIFYFNHIGIMDGLCVPRALPRKIRQKLVTAVTSEIWEGWRAPLVETFIAGFRFDKEKKIKASLELTGEFLDRGYSILMAPEGTFTKDGRLLKFKPGAGFLAVEMQAPVVPFKISTAYREIFPPRGGWILGKPTKGAQEN